MCGQPWPAIQRSWKAVMSFLKPPCLPTSFRKSRVPIKRLVISAQRATAAECAPLGSDAVEGSLDMGLTLCGILASSRYKPLYQLSKGFLPNPLLQHSYHLADSSLQTWRPARRARRQTYDTLRVPVLQQPTSSASGQRGLRPQCHACCPTGRTLHAGTAAVLARCRPDRWLPAPCIACRATKLLRSVAGPGTDSQTGCLEAHLYACSLRPMYSFVNWSSSQPARPSISQPSAGALGRMKMPNHWRASSRASTKRDSIACSPREYSAQACEQESKNTVPQQPNQACLFDAMFSEERRSGQQLQPSCCRRV